MGKIKEQLLHPVLCSNLRCTALGICWSPELKWISWPSFLWSQLSLASHFHTEGKKNVLQMTPKPAWNRTTARSHTAFSVSRISRLSFTFFFCWQWVSLLPVTPALMQSHLLIEWHSILIHNCLSISKFIDFSLFRSLGNSVSLWHICLGPSTMIMSIYSLFSFFFGCLSFGIKIWTIWTIWPSVT